MTELRVTFKNLVADGGTFNTPAWFAFHDGSFDLYDRGVAASAGLEQLAEDGGVDGLDSELAAASAAAQSLTIPGAAGVIAPGETVSATIDVDGTVNTRFNYATMVIPSNDAFIGNGVAATLFDEGGNFNGETTIEIAGSAILDAGTEQNTVEDAAFLNHTAPNTGLDENGTVELHPGFNGSLGNPGGNSLIFGGTTAAGTVVDQEAADFTQPGFEAARIHVNTVATTTGDAGRNVLRGGSEDDLADLGDGSDVALGGDGWDEINGDGGRDFLFGQAGDDILRGGEGNDRLDGGIGDDELFGGAGIDRLNGRDDDDRLFGGDDRDVLDGGDGDDLLDGGADRDALIGRAGDDWLRGGEGNDRLFGGTDNDVLEGGAGIDRLFGGDGRDTFVFATGDGLDIIEDFNEADDGTGDVLYLSIAGVSSLADVQAAATQFGGIVRLDFGTDDLFLRGVTIADFEEEDFIFA